MQSNFTSIYIIFSTIIQSAPSTFMLTTLNNQQITFTTEIIIIKKPKTSQSHLTFQMFRKTNKASTTQQCQSFYRVFGCVYL